MRPGRIPPGALFFHVPRTTRTALDKFFCVGVSVWQHFNTVEYLARLDALQLARLPHDKRINTREMFKLWLAGRRPQL